MTKRLIVLLSVFLGIVFSTPLFADQIRISSDEWCPYMCEPNSEKPGYIVEIARIIFSRQGHGLDYTAMPWSRCISYAREGKREALPGATKGEVPDFVFPDESFGISQTHFFVRKGDRWRYSGVDSLKQVNVGIQDDYEYGESVDGYFKKNKGTRKVQVVSGESPIRTNIRKLLKGRIDVVPEDNAVFLNAAKDMGVLDQIQDAGAMTVTTRKDLEELKLYLAFSPDNPKSKKYAEILSEGIRQMRKSGELEVILAKYGMKDWKPELEAISKHLNK